MFLRALRVLAVQIAASTEVFTKTDQNQLTRRALVTRIKRPNEPGHYSVPCKGFSFG